MRINLAENDKYDLHQAFDRIDKFSHGYLTTFDFRSFFA